MENDLDKQLKITFGDIHPAQYGQMAKFLAHQKELSRKEENKEWREGRRCEMCGVPKDSNLASMCDECFKNG